MVKFLGSLKRTDYQTIIGVVGTYTYFLTLFTYYVTQTFSTVVTFYPGFGFVATDYLKSEHVTRSVLALIPQYINTDFTYGTTFRFTTWG